MSAIVRRPPPRVTLEDFLAWPGDGTAKRHQLVDGEIRAMAPASTTHAAIQATLALIIGRHLEEQGSPCWVAIAPGVVPQARASLNVRVPDLAVTCSQNVPGQLILPEPVLLIEVLSPGNESDTRENVWTYTTIPSVREIVVVHSTKIAAEVLRRRPDGTWPENPEAIGRADALRLDSVGLVCRLFQAYARTHLA